MQPQSREIVTRTGLSLHLVEWSMDPDEAREPAASGQHSVVLVHGFLDSAWTFKHLVEAWYERAPERVRGLHLVAVDLRGHGDSGRVGAGGYYHFFDYLDDMHDLVEQLGRERVSLVGHSMGGNICSYYAGAYPERVHRLALLEAIAMPEHAIDMPARIRTWLASRERVRQSPPRSYSSVADAAARLRQHDPLLPEAMASELATHLTREHGPSDVRFKHDPEHLTRGPYPFRLDIAESLWSSVRAPVLYVRGRESSLPVSDAELERRLRLMGTVDIRVLEGAGHMLQRHRPHELAALLDAFICT